MRNERESAVQPHNCWAGCGHVDRGVILGRIGQHCSSDHCQGKETVGRRGHPSGVIGAALET